MKEVQEFIPITKAKNELLELIRRVEAQDETVAITKKGVPSVVMMSRTKFEGLLETIDILSDEATMTSLKKGIKEIKEGKWAELEEAFGE
ncbi:MAG: type II toxin-antitoxin system Phd/YefM family antitoxin [Nitrospirae bacterium]|nr:type II toxin-antitoxin system Phd/YefM family antitoxin [Nitrospirota bacterium]